MDASTLFEINNINHQVHEFILVQVAGCQVLTLTLLQVTSVTNTSETTSLNVGIF